MPRNPLRNKDLARIHLAAKELGMDQDTYRAFLKVLTGKESARELDDRQRWKVLQELGHQGAASGTQVSHSGRPKPQGPAKDPMIRKIEAHLATAKRPWAYVHAMAQRMFSVDRVECCDTTQLHSIVAALELDAKRHGRL